MSKTAVNIAEVKSWGKKKGVAKISHKLHLQKARQKKRIALVYVQNG